MRLCKSALLALSALFLLTAGRGAAQTPTPGGPDAGVRPNRLIDRAEIRVSRVEIDPGAVRGVHAHDDVEYHLWMPLDGSLEITIESDGPVIATPWQPFFMERGTLHGFRNVGTSPAAVLEIFVKQSDVAGDWETLMEFAQGIAQEQAGPPRR